MSSSKFLVISREGGDFSMDLIYAGLVRRFGRERVLDYPSREKYRRDIRVLPPVGDPEKDYGRERMSLGHTPNCHGQPETYKADVVTAIQHQEVDYVFMDETEESFVEWMSVVGRYPHHMHTKVVIVAGHDRFRGDPISQYARNPKLAAMFIDDWQPEYDSLPKAHLINLSSNFDHLWEVDRRAEFNSDKKYDICFVGYNSRPVRKMVIDHLKDKWGGLNNYIVFEERQDEFSAFIRHKELFEVMARSRICINLPGASVGGRALRFYEIPYVGSYMLSLNFKAKLLHPFVDRVHCNYFNDYFDMDTLIEQALVRPEERELIAFQGHEHMMRYHTVDARMDYIFSILEP